jgi:hypothetical protein
VLGLAASAALALVSGAGLERALSSYLTSFAFFLSLSVGALFFVLLHHLVRAGWSVVVRRIAEVMAANMLVLAALALPVVFGLSRLYPWAAPGAAAHDPLIAAKQPYLNAPFFLARMAIYFFVWTVTALWYHRLSSRQDLTGDFALTRRMESRSAPAMVLFAITVCVAAFDLLMSLDPHWYSTMFGVYFFAGSAVGFFAALAVVSALLLRAGYLQRAVSAEHFHDMGKLVFAFTVFWAYIAFSQYMLIWYANLPEETGWLLRRQTNGWQYPGLGLLFGHFLVPFALLLPRFVKRSPRLLILPAAWVLVMHWLDLYWVVMPEAGAGQGTPAPRLADLTCFVGIGGIYIAAAAHRLRRGSLVPEQDPRLEESLAFESA